MIFADADLFVLGGGSGIISGLTGAAGTLGGVVFTLVGLSAVYQGLMWKGIQARWGGSPARA